MGRPSKFGEKTELMRVPISKLGTIQDVIDGSFVQNSTDDQVDPLVDALLAQCEALEIPARRMVFHLHFKQVCETLDRFTPQEQKEFCARLLDRYLVEPGDRFSASAPHTPSAPHPAPSMRDKSC